MPKDSEIARLVREADCGVLVPPEDAGAMARAVRDLSRRPGRLQELGDNGRRYVCEHFARKEIVRRYHALLHDVVTTAGGRRS